MADRERELKLRLSMLLDGELDGRDNPRLIERIESDERLREAWTRYHLIGQAMRAPQGLSVGDDFARRVRQAIDREPTVLAPRARPGSSTEGRQRIVGFALAASLAAVALMVGKSVMDHGGELYSNLVSTQVAATVPPSDSVADSQFSDYLLTHNETAYLVGSAGMLPYVRSVSYGVERH